MSQGLYEKEHIMAVALLSAIAGESIFLLGPPGTAKSMVSRRLKLVFKGAKSFEYLMSRFSTPDEIFGVKNFKNDITRVKSNPKNFDRKAYGNEKDMILFYSKNPQKNIWNEIRIPIEDNELTKKFKKIDADGRRLSARCRGCIPR